MELTTPMRIVEPAAPALRTNGAATEPRITPDAPIANSRRVMVISIPSLRLRFGRSDINIDFGKYGSGQIQWMSSRTHHQIAPAWTICALRKTKPSFVRAVK
jgi:hypothetical protein